MEFVALDRYENLPARAAVGGDQTINIIRCELDLGRLACALLLFEILPLLLNSLSLIFRSAEFWDRYRRFRNRMRFRQPINAVHNRRVPLKTPEHASYTSDHQHDRKHQQNKTTSGETAQSFSLRRRLDPGVHGR